MPNGFKGRQRNIYRGKCAYYVEQVIKNLKDFRILKSEMQLKCLPIVDDIIRTCALNNLKKLLKT